MISAQELTYRAERDMGRHVRLRGAPARLLQDLASYRGDQRVLEYLIDGPRGTGKTLGCGWVIRWIAHQFPGSRQLFCRKTRRSITQSFCPDFEAIVLRDDPFARKGPKASHRDEYIWENGSVLVLGGADDPLKIYSTNFDVVWEEEAAQFEEDGHEQFKGVLRQWTPGMPFQLHVAMTNPRNRRHYLLQRALSGKSTRLKSWHSDNPKWYDAEKKAWTQQGLAYMRSLQSLSGVRYKRLYLGEWCSAEGAVYECWDEDRHVVDTAPAEPRWYCAAMDWGFTDPCALLVACIESDGRATIVREIYHSKKSIEWWTARVLEVVKEYKGLEALVVDPSRPEVIDHFNTSMRHAGDIPCAYPADNVRSTAPNGDLAGIDLVRDYLERGKLNVLKDRLQHWPDELLVEISHATCLTDEIEDYVYWRPTEDEDDRRSTDKTDPACADHAMDALRYLITYVNRRDLSRRRKRVLPAGAAPYDLADMEMLGR